MGKGKVQTKERDNGTNTLQVKDPRLPFVNGEAMFSRRFIAIERVSGGNSTVKPKISEYEREREREREYYKKHTLLVRETFVLSYRVQTIE